MPAAIRKLKSEKRLNLILDREDQRALLEVADYERLSFSAAVRRVIHAEARRIRTEKQRASA